MRWGQALFSFSQASWLGYLFVESLMFLFSGLTGQELAKRKGVGGGNKGKQFLFCFKVIFIPDPYALPIPEEWFLLTSPCVWSLYRCKWFLGGCVSLRTRMRPGAIRRLWSLLCWCLHSQPVALDAPVKFHMHQNPDEDIPFILFPLFPGILLPTPFYLPATLR